VSVGVERELRYHCRWSARGAKCRVGCSLVGALWRVEKLYRELVGWVRWARVGRRCRRRLGF
jgi:hypothetical protein